MIVSHKAVTETVGYICSCCRLTSLHSLASTGVGGIITTRTAPSPSSGTLPFPIPQALFYWNIFSQLNSSFTFFHPHTIVAA